MSRKPLAFSENVHFFSQEKLFITMEKESKRFITDWFMSKRQPGSFLQDESLHNNLLPWREAWTLLPVMKPDLVPSKLVN